MAIATVKSLLSENTKVVDFYKNAVELWEGIWNNSHSETVDGLADILGSQQFYFENRCGDRYLGQEIMVWSGFGLLYDIGAGFEGEYKLKALRLKDAFQKSHCSLEVVFEAKRAANHFDLE